MVARPGTPTRSQRSRHASGLCAFAARPCSRRLAIAAAADKENTLYIDLKDDCRVVIEMRPDLAPKHVAQIKKLAREGKYDGVVFHRVIDGFMAQTGDPTRHRHGRHGRQAAGRVQPASRMCAAPSRWRAPPIPTARAASSSSCFEDSNFLDGQYTVWGKVMSGMDFVDKIKKGAPGSGAVAAPADKMIKVQVAADVKE